MREFPGSPIRTPRSQCGGRGSIPGELRSASHRGSQQQQQQKSKMLLGEILMRVEYWHVLKYTVNRLLIFFFTFLFYIGV